jgi:hypothetical protein
VLRCASAFSHLRLVTANVKTSPSSHAPTGSYNKCTPTTTTATTSSTQCCILVLCGTVEQRMHAAAAARITRRQQDVGLHPGLRSLTGHTDYQSATLNATSMVLCGTYTGAAPASLTSIPTVKT